VRLTQGDYAQKSVYYKNPADVAERYKEVGIRRLHLVDLDGAKASEPRNLRVLEEVARRTGLDVQYGGGIKSAAALRAVFDAGARRAICGSVAVSEPEAFELWLSEFGPERIILGADVRDGRVATHGWLQESTVTAADLIGRFAETRAAANLAETRATADLAGDRATADFTGDRATASSGLLRGARNDGKGLSQAIVTDISRDGMLTGPAFELYATLQDAFLGVEITASGGISSVSDIRRLDAQGIRSVIVGKALYENKITLEELSFVIRNS
jgi:phosphoribosylformimino-5-aminoimidazole carboxamide ribotide isomerase